jgi:hypothetical protein
MTNWCRCEVRISGRAERVREFLAFAKNGDGRTETVFDFNRFVPPPAEFSKPVMFREDDTWWCDHWGTSGNARNAVIGDFNTTGEQLNASVEFLTAWSPPVPVILKSSEMFPDLTLTLRYFEPLGDFEGSFQCRGGVSIHDECKPCDHTVVG